MRVAYVKSLRKSRRNRCHQAGAVHDRLRYEALIGYGLNLTRLMINEHSRMPGGGVGAFGVSGGWLTSIGAG